MSLVVALLETALPFAASVSLCLGLARPVDWRWLGAGLAYLLADDAVAILAPDIPGVYGNWIGKLASLALAVGVAAALRISRAELPLGPPAGRSGWRCVLLAAGLWIPATAALGWAFNHHAPLRLDKLLFQAAMPGLAEEMAYRGVAFAILVRAYGGPATPHAAIAAAVCLTCVFAAGHGIDVDHGRLQVQWISAAFAGAFSALAFLVRLKSRSLPALVVLHNLTNVASALAAATP